VPSATARKLIRTTMTTLFCVDPDSFTIAYRLEIKPCGDADRF
jgi:hypothetical protein